MKKLTEVSSSRSVLNVLGNLRMVLPRSIMMLPDVLAYARSSASAKIDVRHINTFKYINNVRWPLNFRYYGFPGCIMMKCKSGIRNTADSRGHAHLNMKVDTFFGWIWNGNFTKKHTNLTPFSFVFSKVLRLSSIRVHTIVLDSIVS